MRDSTAGRLPMLRGGGAAAERTARHSGTRHRGAPGAWPKWAARAACTGAGAPAAVPVPSVPSGARGGPPGAAARAMVWRRPDRAGAGAVRTGHVERARTGAHVPVARRGWLSAGALGDADTLGRISAAWRVVWREGAGRGAPTASRGGAGDAPAGGARRAQAGCCSVRQRVCGSADRSLISIVRERARGT